MWWMFIIPYIIYIQCVNAKQNISHLIPNYEETDINLLNSITECILTIGSMVFFYKPTITILKQKKNNSDQDEFFHELIIKMSDNNIPQIMVEDYGNIESHDYHIHSLTIIYFDECDDIINYNFTIVEENMRFLIIISSESNEDCSKNLEEIGESVSKLDVTFIIEDDIEGKLNLFSVLPRVNGHTCEETIDNPKKINTCIMGVTQNEYIFPVKNPVNLHGCPFKVGMATLFPFSTIKDKEKLKNYDKVQEMKGSDFEIMKIITKYINASLEVYYIYRREENPYIDKEFLKFLQNESLDACAGGLYRIYGDEFKYSGIYSSQDVMWIYCADRAERSWENLIQKIHGLYIFIIFYFSYSFMWYIICQFDGDSASMADTFFYSWGVLIGATSFQTARTSKQRILNLMNLIMGIYLCVYVTLQLYSFLTIRPPPKMFKTNDEVMASGRKAVLQESIKNLITDENYEKFANTSDNCASFEDCAEKTFLHNGLTVYLQSLFYVFQALTAVNGEAKILRASENVLTIYNEMIIRNDSTLVVKIQKVMQRLFEGGITRRLFTEAVGISVVAKAGSANTNTVSNSYSCRSGCSITLEQCAGIFYVWIFGCVVSFFVFLVERFTNQKKAKGNQ